MPFTKNLNVNNAFKQKLLLEFKSIFPDEKPKTPKEYLKGGSKSIILNVASFFLGFKNRNSKFEDSRAVLEMLFGPENNQLANDLLKRIRAIERETESPVLIINAYSSLTLFEIFFQTEEQEETQTHAEFEVNIFKAYLVLNSIFTAKQQVAYKSTEHLKGEDMHLPMMIFCMFYSSSDKVNYDIHEIWVTQTIKAILLFRFLQSEPRTQPLLNAFLKYFNCKIWEEYIKRLMPLTFSAIKSDHEAHTDIPVPKGEQFNEICSFIDKLILKETSPIEEYDFLSLRATPLYKISEGVYRIIFNLFVVEKIFKGLYFFLRNINETLPPSEKIANLRSLYSQEFSEKILLYQTLEIIFPDKCIRFSGEQLKSLGMIAEPDEYIKKGKNIFLFESKDFLISAAIKESCDFNLYLDEFEKRLYFQNQNNKQKPGAVMQLINNIRRIIKKEFPGNEKYDYRDVNIYPILVTHDHQYDTAGLNILINDWFQAEVEILAEEEKLFTKKIKPLVIINIDTLIYHQEIFRDKFPLNEALDEYHKSMRILPGIKLSKKDATDYVQSKFIPFSVFVHNLFFRKRLRKMPQMLKELSLTLFNDGQ